MGVRSLPMPSLVRAQVRASSCQADQSALVGPGRLVNRLAVARMVEIICMIAEHLRGRANRQGGKQSASLLEEGA